MTGLDKWFRIEGLGNSMGAIDGERSRGEPTTSKRQAKLGHPHK